MGKQQVKTFRGRCESRTTGKNGKPKHAGNFSYQTFHLQSLQSRDYRVWRAENGHLIVGEHTPLLSLVPAAVVALAMDDPTFDSITLRWYKEKCGRRYECSKRLTRFAAAGSRSWCEFEFMYREEIYTDNDFNYEFPNY